MARTIRWTESATSDLEEAAEFIARDSRFYAAALVRETQEAAQSLRALAERGRMVPEINPPGHTGAFHQKLPTHLSYDG